MTITYIGDCDVRWVYERRIEAPSSLKCVRLSGPRASFPRWLEDEVRDVLDLTLNYYKICWWNSDLGFQYKYRRETNKILNVECMYIFKQPWGQKVIKFISKSQRDITQTRKYKD